MKENIKNFVFYMLFCYSIIIVFLILFNMFSIKNNIELHDNDSNLKRFNSLKSRVYNLENNSCSLLLNEMIDAYNKTSFDGSISLSELREIYWEGPSFLSFYLPIQEKCDMSSEKMGELMMHNDVLNSVTYLDNLMMDNIYNYELKIKDYSMRDISQTSISQIEYQTCKASELDMIEKVLDFIGGKANE